jgi:hypothetical protein
MRSGARRGLATKRSAAVAADEVPSAAGEAEPRSLAK